MNRMTPTWLSSCSSPSELAGNSCADTSGHPGADERRPEHDAGDDLADDRRLSEVARSSAEHARGGDDDEDLEDQACERMRRVGAQHIPHARRRRMRGPRGSVQGCRGLRCVR